MCPSEPRPLVTPVLTWQVAKLTGRVFLERNEVNLYSNILDTPEFFWEVAGRWLYPTCPRKAP